MSRRPVNSMATTLDWAGVGSSIAIWAIGSCEQHGPHLPIGLDTLMAEYFARRVAEAFEGALLPSLPIFQCVEHSGFRGSIGVRPETAISWLRDVAESLEAQNFRRLVLINGHGGNQVLPPVVRDWNRRDRPLKMILMNWYEWDQSPEGNALREGQLHADAWETSVALALCPERVGDYVGLRPVRSSWEGRVSDLNHFGISAFRPAGYWGDPSRASAQAGWAIVRSVEKNLVAAIRERLEWMEKDARYTGAGSWTVRPLHPVELEQGWQLARSAGWNQTLADWEMIQRLWPDHVLGAIHNGRVIGTTALALHETKQAWIAMVLVDPSFRRMGIASALVRQAMQHAPSGCRVGLDATADGREVYRKLGFEEVGSISRFAIPVAPVLALRAGIRPMTEADLPSVAELDARTFGAFRMPLLTCLRAARPDYAFVTEQDGRIVGFVMGRSGLVAEHIGPLVAGTMETAQGLAAAVLRVMNGRPVFLDVPDTEGEWREWLMKIGFREQRRFTRMTVGGKPLPVSSDFRCFGIAGPEFG